MMLDKTTKMSNIIKNISPFNQLPREILVKLTEKIETIHYPLGETILLKDRISQNLLIICTGQVRLLGYDPRTAKPVTLEKLESGTILGAYNLINDVHNVTAIASTDVDCLVLPKSEFLTLLNKYPSFAQFFQEQCSLIEIFNLLGTELQRNADGTTNLKELAVKAVKEAIVCQFTATKSEQLDSRYIWFISSENPLNQGSRFNPDEYTKNFPRDTDSLRLVGIPKSLFTPEQLEITTTKNYLPTQKLKPQINHHYPFIAATGLINQTLACFQMVGKHLNVPCKREVIRRVLVNQQQTNTISLQFCAAVADLMGLQSQLINLATTNFAHLPTPALIRWEDSFAVIYESTHHQVVLADPNTNIRCLSLATFTELWGESGQVLLLKAGTNNSQKKFGLSWFIPVMLRYRRVLIEVFLASFFVQLFGLVNPLMTQVIIDRVIGGNSLDTLHVLGIFLIVVAIFEAVLSSLRTYLFSDTTNRIDLSLGSEIIDHLLRLPLAYFGRRPVGELATRIQELENIRSFLTGTALTVVLDVLFSVIYIAVMLVYSPVLTLTALGIVPVFIALTLIFSPILRRMLRTKAESNAKTQSYLIEVLSGMETVKAQNIELRSRMSWQDRYARYVSDGFKAVQLSAVAGSLSTFLNKLSSLLVLWVGAYLVLKNQLTLGELIAFRIIAGYVTSPLQRLSQIWQNFQETILSIERLGDILNHPQETLPESQNNIPLPTIKGAVKYENISFRFAPSGPLQLYQINLDIPAGQFVGIVGQSGSGKSTLTKLLPRLYEPNSGRILIDGYDISKVELNSLRRQVGIVPQNTLLFDGTIHENIALTKPDATTEEIIAATKIAAAHDFIMDLPNGYNTRVGERGSALSGGQRQRIAIARTILQNPQLLILDEATSALDYETEQQVCHNLSQAFKNRTVLFITHRLSTIKNADLILMMANGAVVEQGTHTELMAQKERYYCLYRQQDSQM